MHYEFKLRSETLYLAVNIIDRFLEKQPVMRKNLQLVGVTAMLLACKYEEVTKPLIYPLVDICDHAYTRKEILDMVSRQLRNYIGKIGISFFAACLIFKNHN